MSYHLIFREEVRDEIESAYSWYEIHRIGLGDKFLEELGGTFNLLKSNPQYFSFIYQTRRRIILKRFPYKVVFEIFDTSVVIFSLRHDKQKPKF
jgi:hypothetical protein